VYGGGAIYKYEFVAVCPKEVATEICPEDVLAGTFSAIVVELTDVGIAYDAFTFTRSFAGVGSKFVPVTLIAVPETALEGTKLAIVGLLDAPTVNAVALFTVPSGAVTAIAPEVAPMGTLVVSWVAVEVRTAADVPLNVTAF
jgi:hypothetical protein